MKFILFLFFFIILNSKNVLCSIVSSQVEHQVYFEKTDFELHVFKIKGAETGNTLMLIGGIQGDEPGGYVSADLYADVRLKKGNIIVVPRANLASILANKRLINKDMNRRFTSELKKDIYEDKIVEVLVSLMQESDLLLNLHEGSGFYNPKYIDHMNNPMRFGQCIIADTDVYKSHRCNCDLKLKDMAERVIEKVNLKIKNEKYKFKFNNHNTFDPKTRHAEQRQSATFYALSTVGIPSFGVEVSKEIKDLPTKVQMHSSIINAFMNEMGIEFATPSIEILEPTLKYLLVKVGDDYKVLSKSDVLNIEKGQTILIKHIESNYGRGIIADVLGLGGINDYGKSLQVNKSTTIVIKKDSKIISKIPVKVSDTKIVKQYFQPPQLLEKPKLLWFVVRVGKEDKIVPPDTQINVYEGEDFEIVNVVFYPAVNRSDYIVNFVGYYGGTEYGIEDDLGLKFTMNGSLLKRFQIQKDVYGTYVKYRGEKISQFSVKINKPKIRYFIVEDDAKEKKCYLSGETLSMKGKKLFLYDLVADLDTSLIDLESPCGFFRYKDVKGKNINNLISCLNDSQKGQTVKLKLTKDKMLLGSLDIVTH